MCQSVCDGRLKYPQVAVQYVHDSGEVGIGHHGSGKVESRLELGALIVCSEQGVQLLEGTLRPDNEAAKVSAWSQVQQR